MELKSIKTGTTTVGVIAKDSIILAADMRASLGHLAYHEESKKIYKITDNIAITNAGSVGDSLVLIRFLRSQAKLYELERGDAMSPKALASLLSNVLNAHRYYPYLAQFIIAGYENSSPQLFEVGPFGGVLERNNFAVSGSGTELALSVFDQEYKKTISKDEAIILAVKAVNAATKRDIYSGGKALSIMVISENAIKELSWKEVNKYIAKAKKLE